MTVNQALIGHTGFVGGNLMSQENFNGTYSSANIGEIEGRAFDRIVCAGVSAVKWWANQNPDKDLAKIENLISHLKSVKSDRFTLISTVDVYNDPQNVDEDDVPDAESLHAYGRNRLYLETFIKSHFPNTHIVRLPALFGPGLRKNAIFDLQNDNQTDLINPAGSFQWYPVDRLAKDLQVVEKNNIPVINFATEPLTMSEIHRKFFPNRKIGEEKLPAPSYDFHTKYATVFGEQAPYMLRKPAISLPLEDYINRTAKA